ncbi:MAG TPA: PIN domain-containing protein [Chloroflexota bacterium]|jgi:predicted nucleic acid-binding protein
MTRVFWDTNLFIYLIEEYPDLSPRVVELRRRMLARGDQLCTSALTLGEVLVKPTEVGDETLRQRYETAIAAGALILPFDRATARRYATIRAADRSIRPPDAIQLACAAEGGIDLFITNDERLSRKIVPGIRFITSLERAFL